VDQLDKLGKKFQNEYDQTSKVVQKLEEEPQNQATTTELNRLQQLQKGHRIKIRLTGLKAEKAADDRDAVLSKECRVFIKRLNNKRGTILILGLPNSGKKTLLNTLKENKFDQYSSSFSAGSQQLLIGNMKFTCTNIDLQHDGRLSRQIPMNDAIIFLIDLTDPIRFSTAKEIIMFLLNDKEISSKPLVIVGTKKDLFANVDEADRIFPCYFGRNPAARNLLESAKTVPKSRRAVPDPTQISTGPVAGMIDLGWYTIHQNRSNFIWQT
ncbi:unnamed protein product, partial [Adineta ricciae]